LNTPGKILIANGRLIDPANGVDGTRDLYIVAGRIQGVGQAPADFHPDLTIDAAGLVVCPGLIDMSSRHGKSGQKPNATLKSETRAAAKSGITTVCCPPDTDPVIDTPAMATLVQEQSRRIGYTRLLPVGALTRGLDGEQLSEMVALQQAGCVAFSNGERPLANTLVERRALEYAATFNLTVMLRPEDQHLRDSGCVHEGPVASRLGLPGIPEVAETVATARDLALAEHSGCHAHFRGLSTGAAVRMLAQAQNHRLNVSADVAVHQLHLTEMDLVGFDSNCHVIPPLRGLSDRDTLRSGVSQGIIGAICSDHQPRDPDDKEAPFPSTKPGISGLETLLPLTLRLVQEGVLTLPQAIARLTCGPADILGLSYGRLSNGSAADICIFDPARHWQLGKQDLYSSGCNTPFIGWDFTGQVTHTLLEGVIVYEAAD